STNQELCHLKIQTSRQNISRMAFINVNIWWRSQELFCRLWAQNTTGLVLLHSDGRYCLCRDLSEQVLVANVTIPNSTEHMKELTLDAICYICQDIHTEQLKDNSNTILTVIILGKRKEDPNRNVKFIASKALLNYWCSSKHTLTKNLKGNFFSSDYYGEKQRQTAYSHILEVHGDNSQMLRSQEQPENYCREVKKYLKVVLIMFQKVCESQVNKSNYNMLRAEFSLYFSDHVATFEDDLENIGYGAAGLIENI
ncbi:Importin subunit beta-1, partial [Galemys pyrenaicus]